MKSFDIPSLEGIVQEKVTQEVIQKLETYISFLLETNQQFNLIGPNEIERLWTRHILDSAQLYPYLKPLNGQNIADLGSGAGFPGFVLSCLGIKNVILIESLKKKSEFLEKAGFLTESDLKVIHRKAQNVPRGTFFEVIISRAMAKLSTLIEYSLPLSLPSTKYFFMKGRTYKIELEEALKKFNFDYKLLDSVTDPESKIIYIEKISKI